MLLFYKNKFDFITFLNQLIMIDKEKPLVKNYSAKYQHQSVRKVQINLRIRLQNKRKGRNLLNLFTEIA